MSRVSQVQSRGFFAIGVEGAKTEHNIGTLWRSAQIFGASFIFTVGRRYKPQCSDTLKSYRHLPLIHFADLQALIDGLPYSTPLVGVELTDSAEPIRGFSHPHRACYLLGAEDHGLSANALSQCHQTIKLPGRFSMNVAVAGSLVCYHRTEQAAKRKDMHLAFGATA